MASGPILTIETASLWASGDASTFTGTGGPAAFDPFLASFSAVVNSDGIAATPFNDTVDDVEEGDQVVFVIALQNFSNTVSAYGITLFDTVPAGFEVPATGAGLTVTDGAGNPLGYSGDLFTPGLDLTLTSPLAPYSDTSGANVALITFTLQASTAIVNPAAQVSNTAQILSYAASAGGPNLAGSSTTALTSSTNVVTGSITVASSADQVSAPLASGQTDSFDITISVPGGTTQNLAIAEQLVASGGAAISLVSVQAVSIGADLTTTLPAVEQPGGSIQLGRVVDTPNGLPGAADQIVVRVTVANAGTTAGTATLDTTVSAANPNVANTNWSTTVSNAVPLATPDTPPTIAAASISPSQATTSDIPVDPFASIVFADPDIGQTQTLTIHLSNAGLGTLSGPGLGVDSSGDDTLSGAVAAVQAAARALVFTPAPGTGTETFDLTLNDNASGIATNDATTLAIAAASPSSLASYPISTQTVLTSTPTGTSTYAQVQSYEGPVSNVQTQYLYDGANPIAIVAQQSGMLISSAARDTAVQLQGGTNVVDITAGSAFVTSGTGNDTFLLQASTASPTWSTIANFHAGDSVTIYGIPSTAEYGWLASAGAPGYTGATLHIDINGDGITDSSVTFAGASLAAASHFTETPGAVGGMNYLQISA